MYGCYDADDAGSNGGTHIIEQLNNRTNCRVYKVTLPEGCKDAGDFFGRGGTAAKFQKFLDAAELRTRNKKKSGNGTSYKPELLESRGSLMDYFGSITP